MTPDMELDRRAGHPGGGAGDRGVTRHRGLRRSPRPRSGRPADPRHRQAERRGQRPAPTPDPSRGQPGREPVVAPPGRLGSQPDRVVALDGGAVLGLHGGVRARRAASTSPLAMGSWASLGTPRPRRGPPPPRAPPPRRPSRSPRPPASNERRSGSGRRAAASSRAKRTIDASPVAPWTRTSAISRVHRPGCASSAARLSKPRLATAPLTEPMPGSSSPFVRARRGARARTRSQCPAKAWSSGWSAISCVAGPRARASSSSNSSGTPPKAASHLHALDPVLLALAREGAGVDAPRSDSAPPRWVFVASCGACGVTRSPAGRRGRRIVVETMEGPGGRLEMAAGLGAGLLGAGLVPSVGGRRRGGRCLACGRTGRAGPGRRPVAPGRSAVGTAGAPGLGDATARMRERVRPAP